LKATQDNVEGLPGNRDHDAEERAPGERHEVELKGLTVPESPVRTFPEGFRDPRRAKSVDPVGAEVGSPTARHLVFAWQR
jgi:hypothetical protein